MRVFLIHGMGRTPASMWILDRRLKSAGYEPSLFGYFVTVDDLATIADRFRVHVERVLAQDTLATGRPPEYAIVSHSLGGVITRMASPDLPAGFRSFVMLAPPNRPPAVVEAIKSNPLFRLLTGDAGRRLRSPDFYDALPRPAVPSLIVAGSGGPRAAWLPFAGEPNDAVLSVAETRLEDVPQLEVPAVHTFLMNRDDVFAAIRAFFAEHGFNGAAEAGAEAAGEAADEGAGDASLTP